MQQYMIPSIAGVMEVIRDLSKTLKSKRSMGCLFGLVGLYELPFHIFTTSHFPFKYVTLKLPRTVWKEKVSLTWYRGRSKMECICLVQFRKMFSPQVAQVIYASTPWHLFWEFSLMRFTIKNQALSITTAPCGYSTPYQWTQKSHSCWLMWIALQALI